jgi:hypothetical protein
MNPVHEAIAQCLAWHVGKEYSISAEDLLAHLHLRSEFMRERVAGLRELQAVIHDMRRQGYVVASCASGYFRPRDAAEAYEYLSSVLKSRALDLMVTVRAQRRAIVNEYGRQLRMPL